jgi:nucleotide-binding universal stress UspA family protein
MPFKTILVYCDSSETTRNRLALAVGLAERFGSTLIGVHARPPFQPVTFMESSIGMDALLNAHQESVRRDETAARAMFDDAVKGKPRTTEWRAVDGHPDEVLALHARYADLVIAGQAAPPEKAAYATPDDMPESVALASGRPVLVVPHIGAPPRIGKTIMLCWNASREAARVASEALPLLQAAENVIVLVVDPKPGDGHGQEPGADVATWLARHGIKVTVHREPAADDVGAIILSRAFDHGVDLIIMGIYGHSRMRELILGGASRTMLSSMTVPVFMAH